MHERVWMKSHGFTCNPCTTLPLLKDRFVYSQNILPCPRPAHRTGAEIPTSCHNRAYIPMGGEFPSSDRAGQSGTPVPLQ